MYYPVSDNMGETHHHLVARHLLYALLTDYVRRTRLPAFVGSDLFFYYQRGNPRAVVCPDNYIVDGEPKPGKVSSWKVWERGGQVPTLAIEIVSDEFKKDYSDHLLERYEQLGVRELIRFDPEHAAHRRRKALSHFIRNDAGRLIEHLGLPDRVRSRCYNLWFVLQPNDQLRIATGPDGSTLWPTQDERADAEAEARAAEAKARAAEEKARAAAEARAEAAEAELARLRNR